MSRRKTFKRARWTTLVNALRAAITVAASALAMGCSDVTSPTRRTLTVPPPVRNVQPLAWSEVDLSSVPGRVDSLATYPYVEGLLVEGWIHNFIHITSDSNATAVHVNDDVDYSGVHQTGKTECDWAATIHSGLVDAPGFGACKTTPDYYTKKDEWRDTLVLGGIGGNELVTAKRSGGTNDPQFCTPPPNPRPCHVVTGSQKVRVTPLAATINLTAPAATQIAPKTILIPDPYTLPLRFTVSSDPVSYHGVTVPRQALSWQWIAASGSGYSDSKVCAPPPPTSINYSCNAFIYDRGSVVVTARVNGITQKDTMKVVGKTVSILPDSTRMLFSIHQWKTTQSNVIKHIDRTQRVRVSVVDTANQPIPNQIVTLSLSAHDSSGGHLHAGGEPVGKLDSTRVNTGASGIRYVYYTAPRFSGTITIRGLSGAVHGSTDIQIALPGLDSLPDGNYTKTGAYPGQHVQNHFATPNHIQKLIQFADWFFSWYGAKAQYNDSSLPLGGLYDYNSTWEQPHAAHGEGRATDFFTGNLEPIAIWIAADKWEHMTGVTPGDEVVSGHHLHLMTSN